MSDIPPPTASSAAAPSPSAPPPSSAPTPQVPAPPSAPDGKTALPEKAGGAATPATANQPKPEDTGSVGRYYGLSLGGGGLVLSQPAAIKLPQGASPQSAVVGAGTLEAVLGADINPFESYGDRFDATVFGGGTLDFGGYTGVGGRAGAGFGYLWENKRYAALQFNADITYVAGSSPILFSHSGDHFALNSNATYGLGGGFTIGGVSDSGAFRYGLSATLLDVFPFSGSILNDTTTGQSSNVTALSAMLAFNFLYEPQVWRNVPTLKKDDIDTNFSNLTSDLEPREFQLIVDKKTGELTLRDTTTTTDKEKQDYTIDDIINDFVLPVMTRLGQGYRIQLIFDSPVSGSAQTWHDINIARTNGRMVQSAIQKRMEERGIINTKTGTPLTAMGIYGRKRLDLLGGRFRIIPPGETLEESPDEYSAWQREKAQRSTATEARIKNHFANLEALIFKYNYSINNQCINLPGDQQFTADNVKKLVVQEVWDLITDIDELPDGDLKEYYLAYRFQVVGRARIHNLEARQIGSSRSDYYANPLNQRDPQCYVDIGKGRAKNLSDLIAAEIKDKKASLLGVSGAEDQIQKALTLEQMFAIEYAAPLHTGDYHIQLFTPKPKLNSNQGSLMGGVIDKTPDEILKRQDAEMLQMQDPSVSTLLTIPITELRKKPDPNQKWACLDAPIALEDSARIVPLKPNKDGVVDRYCTPSLDVQTQATHPGSGPPPVLVSPPPTTPPTQPPQAVPPIPGGIFHKP